MGHWSWLASPRPSILSPEKELRVCLGSVKRLGRWVQAAARRMLKVPVSLTATQLQALDYSCLFSCSVNSLQDD